MTRMRALGAFLADFVLGDDPLMFVLVCLGIAATAVVQALGVAAWWVLPIAVVGALAVSVLRGRRTT